MRMGDGWMEGGTEREHDQEQNGAAAHVASSTHMIVLDYGQYFLGENAVETDKQTANYSR